MAVLKKYDLSGKEVGEVHIDDALLSPRANAQMVKDYIVALRNNARQWSANTKTRAEVSHSGQKPHPQKGTGRARQGYLGAPQYKGGGRVGGPRPKFDQHISLNRKEKRSVICQLLIEKIQSGNLHILRDPAFDAPKTKRVANFLEKSSLADSRVLFVGEGNLSATVPPSEKYDVFIKSMRNIPRLKFVVLPQVNGYELALNTHLVLMESALDELKVCLQSGV